MFVPIVQLRAGRTFRSFHRADHRDLHGGEDGRDMESFYILVLVFTLTSVVNARPALPDANPLQLIAQAIGFYNGESHSDVVFKLYKDEYEYKVGPRGHKQANFTIKETMCQKADNQTTESCDFKREGLEKSCTASKNDQEKSLVVFCTAVALEKDPIGSNLESARNQEDIYADQPEEDTSYEDHVIIMDENDEAFRRENDEEKRVIEEFLASKAENDDDKHFVSRTPKRKMQSGQFRGRFLCLECFFDVLPRK